MPLKLKAARWLPYRHKSLVYCFRETHDQEPRPIAYGSHNWNALLHFVPSNRCEPFEFVRVNFAGHHFFFALSGWEFLHKAKRKRSGNSGAIYIAKRDLGDRGFLLQVVGSYQETSGHAHSKKTESFNPILGRPIVKLGTPRFEDGKREVKLWNGLFVPEGVWHQLVTEDAPAITIIEVVGPDALGMGDYIRE